MINIKRRVSDLNPMTRKKENKERVIRQVDLVDKYNHMDATRKSDCGEVYCHFR